MCSHGYTSVATTEENRITGQNSTSEDEAASAAVGGFRVWLSTTEKREFGSGIFSGSRGEVDRL
jgi:hypothetical protein